MQQNKSLIWIGLALTFLAQLFVPAQMIFEREAILKNGRAFKFELEPIDPADPFRGRYVFLRFANTVYKGTVQDTFKHPDPVYVKLTTNSSGFAEIQAIERTKPENGDFLEATVQSDYQREVIIRYPFERFYMEEYAAPLAEKRLRAVNQDSLQTAYALIRIRDGEGVIENVFINDQPIHEFAREREIE